MRQGWLALITLTIASGIAGAEVLHQTHEASKRDIHNFLKNIPPEIGFKYSAVRPALTIQGMNIHDASFHIGATKFFFKNLCLGHPHIEENILKFSSVALDKGQIISEKNIFASDKAILRNFEIIPSTSKQKKWDDLVFDENTLEENEGFAPAPPESRETVASFFQRLSGQPPNLGNIRFGRVQFENVKIEKRFQTTQSLSKAKQTKEAETAYFTLAPSPRTNEIRSLIQKDGFIIPALSMDNINIEGYGTGAHPIASVKNLRISILYNLLNKNLQNPEGNIRKITLSLDNGEWHEGGNLLQRPGHDEIIAAHQFWDNPEKFFNTAPYGFTLIGIQGGIESEKFSRKTFSIPKIIGERRLTSMNEHWAFKSYFDISGININFKNWPHLNDEITSAFNTQGPSLKIISLSVPNKTSVHVPESWISKLSLDFAVDKQSRIKGYIALKYPPITKHIFQETPARLEWENAFRTSNLSLTFSGKNLPTLLCATWQALKENETVSCRQIHQILHNSASNRPDFKYISEWMAEPEKKNLQANFVLSNFWEWNALPAGEALGNLPITEAKIKPL